MTVYVPGTAETDPKKQNRALAALAAAQTVDEAAITALQTTQASSSTFGLVKVDGTSIKATAGVISTNPTPITASLSGDVALNNTANYFDGPSIAQGTSGTWFASGTVTLTDTAGTAVMNCKLWDGTTVIASATHFVSAGTGTVSVALSGYLASPAANIRISVRDSSRTTGVIMFNNSGNSKDSTISAYRIA